MTMLVRFIYSSQPFAFDEATLGNLLVKARKNNARDGITGALICRRDIYLQLLEGPETAVAATMSRIRADDRHLNVTIYRSGAADRRLFGDWAMLHDPALSWMWPEPEIEDGAPIHADAAEIARVFDKLAEATMAGSD